MEPTPIVRPAVIALCALASLAGGAHGDSLTPGSVLVYPSTTSTGPLFTAVSITNTNLVPAGPATLGGTTTVHLEFVDVLAPAPAGGGLIHEHLDANPSLARALEDDRGAELGNIGCLVSDVTIPLTPADTKTFLTACLNPSVQGRGYLVATATDPSGFNTAWSHDHLIGSELAVAGNGAAWTIPAVAFRALTPPMTPTDVDQDGQLDFDDVEYQGLPDVLYIDKAFGAPGDTLALINLTGGASFTANVVFDVWNDNEAPLTTTLSFQCWIEMRLADISIVFDPGFLSVNSPQDPTDFDVDCDGLGDFETSWARVRGLNASSAFEIQPDPALLGALTGQPGDFGAGRPLWRSEETQDNGDFIKFGSDDPEFSPNQAPVCDAGPHVVVQLGQPAAFDGTGSSDPDGTIATYDWDFGDGTVLFDAGPTPVHVYGTAGDFVVTLTVTDDDGAPSSCSTTVSVTSPPVCDAGPNASVDVGETVTFDGTGSFDLDGGIVAFDWDFGDGTNAFDAGPTPSHAYAAPGNYVVTLTVTDDDVDTTSCATLVSVNAFPLCDAGAALSGNVGDFLAFDGSGSSDPDGTIVTFDWDFGDGANDLDAGPTPSHVYAAPGNYTVTLAVTDDSGAQSLCTTSVAVNAFPVCSLNGPQTVPLGATAPLDGSGSFDPDGAIVQYQWDFGDGNTAISTPILSHVYGAPGTYVVTLTITDDGGSQSSCTTVVTVAAPPVCDVLVRPQQALGTISKFDGSGSFDPGGGPIVSYQWDFGDGDTAVTATPFVNHQYASAGVYVVTLTVTSFAGSSSSCSGTTLIE